MTAQEQARLEAEELITNAPHMSAGKFARRALPVLMDLLARLDAAEQRAARARDMLDLAECDPGAYIEEARRILSEPTP